MRSALDLWESRGKPSTQSSSAIFLQDDKEKPRALHHSPVSGHPRVCITIPVTFETVAAMGPGVIGAHASPDGSTARHENWTGSGVVMVRKLRYRSRSHARTVPSKLALTSAPADGKNATPVTGAVCSKNVT